MKIKELKKLFGNTWRKRINTSSNRKIVLAALIVLVLWLFLFYTPAERYSMRRSLKRWIYSNQLLWSGNYSWDFKRCGRVKIIFGIKIRNYFEGYNKDNCG